MQFTRIFSTEKYKGTRGYLDSQKKYEIIRTILYFGISISLFAAGYIQTGRKSNLLSIVAILGCLPASKSAVGMIMFLRFKSCSRQAADTIEAHSGQLHCLYDLVFTSYQKNYAVAHLTVKGNTICGYSETPDFAEGDFIKHLDGILKMDGHSEVTIKIFTDLKKYVNRLEQLKELDTEDNHTEAILNTLKSVTL